MKNLLIAALFAASLGTIAAPALAATDIIVVRKAPPPLRHEAMPPARHGHVWTPGYWKWSGHRYTWVKGSYVKARAGYRWSAPSWQQREGRWQFVRGEWRRGAQNRHDRGHRVDSDRDGVANHRDRDRDNDGVPNRHDNRPDNPRRY